MEANSFCGDRKCISEGTQGPQKLPYTKVPSSLVLSLTGNIFLGFESWHSLPYLEMLGIEPGLSACKAGAVSETLESSCQTV